MSKPIIPRFAVCEVVPCAMCAEHYQHSGSLSRAVELSNRLPSIGGSLQYYVGCPRHASSVRPQHGADTWRWGRTGPFCVHKVGRPPPLASQSGAPRSLSAPEPAGSELGDRFVSARRGTPVFPGFLNRRRSKAVDFRGHSAPRALISYQSVMEKDGQFLSSTN